MQLARLHPLRGVLQHIHPIINSQSGDLRWQGLECLYVGEALQLHLVNVRLVYFEVAVFVEAGGEGGEVEGVTLQEDLFQLLRHLLAGLVQQFLLGLAHQRLTVFVEGVEYQVPSVCGDGEQSVGPQLQKGYFHRDVVGLVDGHVSDVPELDLVAIAPLPVLLALKLRAGLLLVGLCLVGDECVVVVVGGEVGDDLSGLVLDDDCMRRCALLFVDGEEVALLFSGGLQVEDLDIVLALLTFVLLICLMDYSSPAALPGGLQFSVTIADHLLVEVVAVDAVVGDALFFDIPVGGVEGDADEVGPEVGEEEVVEGGVEADALELDVVIYLVGDLEVVHLQVQGFVLEDTQTVYDQLYDHH